MYYLNLKTKFVFGQKDQLGMKLMWIWLSKRREKLFQAMKSDGSKAESFAAKCRAKKAVYKKKRGTRIPTCQTD